MDSRPCGRHPATDKRPGTKDLKHYLRLGDAGVKRSEIGLGGWLTFGNVLGVKRSADVMAAASVRLVNFFDAASTAGGPGQPVVPG